MAQSKALNNVFKLRGLVSALEPRIGARGDGVTDDTAALNAALALGLRIWLPSDTTYKVSSRLVFTNGAALISDGSATIYATAAGFNNADQAVRYTASSSVLSLLGQTIAPFTELRDVAVKGVTIEYEYTDNRCVDAIAARNVTNLDISDNEIKNFPGGTDIRVSSILGNSKIIGNYCHSRTLATANVQPQLTGIEVDNDRVNSINSAGVDIKRNRVFNLSVTGAALASYGDQSDGINVQFGTLHQIAGNIISSVNEGIDLFADKCAVYGNTIDDVNIGIKVIHSASHNAISGNAITGFVLAGIALYGSATSETNGNAITGNAISGGVASASTTTQACIRLDTPAGDPFKATNNLVANNILDPGSSDWAIYTNSEGSGNCFIDNRIVAAGSQGRVSLNGTEAPVVTEALKTAVRIGRATAQTFNNGVDTKIQFATEQIDRRSEYDNATNYRWTCQIPGAYQAEFTVRFGTMGDGALVTPAIKKNGTTVAIKQLKSGGANDVSYSISDTVICAVGDYIEFFLQQDDAGPQDIAGNVTLCYASINPA